MPYSGQINEVEIPVGTVWEITGGGGGGSVDPATATPLMDGTGAVGTSAKYAREDHVHPSDTSKQDTLVSGTNIKTINGNSLLGSGDLTTPNTMRDPATNAPLMDGTAAVGTSAKYAREDHVHPTDTSRQEVLVSGTNIKTVNGTSLLGSGDITTPIIDPATATPLMDGTAAVGTSAKYAREDHVHPSDTSKQDTLVSGTNIKTINGSSILGSGDLTVNGINNIKDYGISGLRQINSDSTNVVGADAAQFGVNTQATGVGAFAEGTSTVSSGLSSHAEGGYSTASAMYAHAEGDSTTASGPYSHAEGHLTTASGQGSHAEGVLATASGWYSHAEGSGTLAEGRGSHASGYYTSAKSQYQFVTGQFNEEDANDVHAFIVGNGTASNARSNAFMVNWDGRAVLGADPTQNMDAVTKQYLDNAISGVSYTAGKQLTLTGSEFSLSQNPDTRNTNENPQWYMTNYSRRNVVEFKNSNTIGLGTSQTYCALRTYVPWNDSSGGYPVQFATIGNTLYMRIGTSNTAWGSWVDVTANTTYSAGTGISISGTTITATGVKDDNSTNTITFSYNKAGLTTASWFAAWNGYELRAISPANTRTAIGANPNITFSNVNNDTSQNVANNTNTTLCNTGSLAAGTYLLIGHAYFNSNNNGRRELFFATSNGGDALNRYAAITQATTPGRHCHMTIPIVVTHTSATTYYLRGYQNSGSALSVGSKGIQVVKLY